MLIDVVRAVRRPIAVVFNSGTVRRPFLAVTLRKPSQVHLLMVFRSLY
jgi:hypothetical protein